MFVIELVLKLSPFPLSVQRKKADDAESLFLSIKDVLAKGDLKILELTCDKAEDKKIAVLVNDVLAVQLYENSSGIGGAKRPGFALND